MTGVMLASAFAAIIAPRKLQSFGKAEHTEAAAVSSVRSTSNAVASGRIGLEAAGSALGAAMRCLDELEYALRVYFRDAPTKTTSINSDQAIFLFIVRLQLIRLRRLFWQTLENGGHSAIAGDQFKDCRFSCGQYFAVGWGLGLEESVTLDKTCG